jgi:hypothetical protein
MLGASGRSGAACRDGTRHCPEGRWLVRSQRTRGAVVEVECLGTLCDFEGEPRFRQLGINLTLLEPGEPMTMYHWEAAQEDFLMLSGEALLVIEGEERTIRQWDFVTALQVRTTRSSAQALIRVLCLRSARATAQKGKSGARTPWTRGRCATASGVQRETIEGSEAYARFPPSKLTRYRDGWLPD